MEGKLIYVTCDDAEDLSLNGKLVVKDLDEVLEKDSIKDDDFILVRKDELKCVIEEKTAEIKNAQDALTASLTDVLEVRDGSTGGHSKRVAEYTRILVNSLKTNLDYKGIVDEEYAHDVIRCAVIHDIGKVGVLDELLMGPKFDPNDTDSIERMHAHSDMGAKIINSALQTVGGSNSFLQRAYEVARFHHERWDGLGYPLGLSEDEIPLGARIIAVADVYDALTSKRSYKEPYSHETACSIIMTDAGKAFDPKLVQVFAKHQNEFDEARKTFLD